jgi:hypothetical protein
MEWVQNRTVGKNERGEKKIGIRNDLVAEAEEGQQERERRSKMGKDVPNGHGSFDPLRIEILIEWISRKMRLTREKEEEEGIAIKRGDTGRRRRT